MSDRRMWDLCRHMRNELHDAGLITDDEFALLAEDHPAVDRLEGYDAMRQRIAELERERDAAYETLEAIAVKGLCLSAVSGAEMPPDWARYRTMSEHVAALRRERDALAAALEEAKEMFRFIEGHPRYDWNADPEYLTLRIGEIYQSPSQAILDAHDAALTERVQRETLERCEIMCCGTCGGTGHEERGWQGNVECSACDGSGAVVALRTIKREFSKEGK